MDSRLPPRGEIPLPWIWNSVQRDWAVAVKNLQDHLEGRDYGTVDTEKVFCGFGGRWGVG
jgi:hypothetical protein